MGVKNLPARWSAAASRDYKENFVLSQQEYLTSDRVAADENVIAVFIWGLVHLAS